MGRANHSTKRWKGDVGRRKAVVTGRFQKQPRWKTSNKMTIKQVSTSRDLAIWKDVLGANQKYIDVGTC